MPVGSFPAEWLRGTLSLCVLGLLAEGESYGYAIAQCLEEAGIGHIKGGTLYPLLARLEAQKLVVGIWQAGDSGPGRRYLRLTEEGRAELSNRRSQWKYFSAVVNTLAHVDRGDDHV